MLSCIQKLIVIYETRLKVVEGQPTTFPEPPVPAEPDSLGLKKDKRVHKVIAGLHVWKTHLIGNIQLMPFE